jgi:adenylate cyclase
VEAHPQRVAEVALSMQEKVAELRGHRSDVVGTDRLRIGIGIHTAEVVVGNLGSELRFDYTIIGDGVNLCSRLEGLTKYYGVGIIASSALTQDLPDDVCIRELDTIQVVGKDESTRIFEICEPATVQKDRAELLEQYASALESFRSGDWRKAERLATQVQHTLGGKNPDGPTDFLLQRIQNKNAPDDWQGVWNFETK